MEPTSLIYLPDGTVLDPVAVAAIFPAQGDVVSYALQGAPGPRSVVTASGEHALEIKAYMVACKELATPARVHLDGDLHLPMTAAADRTRGRSIFSAREAIAETDLPSDMSSADAIRTLWARLSKSAPGEKQAHVNMALDPETGRIAGFAVFDHDSPMARGMTYLAIRGLSCSGKDWASAEAATRERLRESAWIFGKPGEPLRDAVDDAAKGGGGSVIYTRGEYRDRLLAAIPEPSDETSVFEHVKITTFETETARVDEALSLTRRAADRLRGAVAVLGTPERTPGNPNIWAAQDLMKRAVALCDRVVEGISFWSVDGSGEIPQDHEPDHHR